jgi:hypothetical protein
MARISRTVLAFVAFVTITAFGHSGCAQTSSAGGQQKILSGRSPYIAVSIALPQKQIPADQKPSVVLTVELLGGNLTTLFPETRVHVEGEAGEPPTTLYQRQLTHTFRPGERELRPDDFQRIIGPAASEDGPKFSADVTYDLSRLYDLSKPGKYTVYIEAFDQTASKRNRVWVRSQTAQFEILPPHP